MVFKANDGPNVWSSYKENNDTDGNIEKNLIEVRWQRMSL